MDTKFAKFSTLKGEVFIAETLFEDKSLSYGISFSKDNAQKLAETKSFVVDNNYPDFMLNVGSTNPLNNKENCLFIEGTKNYLISMLPYITLQTYDVYCFVDRNNYNHIGLMAFSILEPSKAPIVLHFNGNSPQEAMENALFGLLLETFKAFSSMGSDIDKNGLKLNTWRLTWLLNVPKVALKEVLHFVTDKVG